ncbi:DUF3850 domain-containing protein [Pseudomonas putida]|nr:DUF3850 domain-containing protein [Pseudomonas putida]
MPTENRSSNTEMVSVPREHELKIRQTPLADLLSGLKTGEIRDCSDREFAVGDTVLLREIDDARDYTGTVLRRTITHVQKNYGLPDHLCVLSYGQPAPQPHPDPIAWMVGTAIWWTKEEAERDAAATGLPVIPVGPMVDTAEIERQKSRADTNALNHRHAKNAIGDIKAYVERLVAASSGQPSVATGYLSDIVAFIVERTKGDPTETSGINALRLELQESRRNEFKMHALMREKDQVLSAVQGQFKRYGERFPDGFDGRLFRWVDDAVSSASAQPEVTS